MSLKQLHSWRRIYQACQRGKATDIREAWTAHSQLFSGSLQEAALVRASQITQNVLNHPAEIKARLQRIEARIKAMTPSSKSTARKEKQDADPAIA